MRPVSSIAGTSYQSLNNFFTPLFGYVPGANIETPSLINRQKLETLRLEAIMPSKPSILTISLLQ